jgi:hypothetical protein
MKMAKKNTAPQEDESYFVSIKDPLDLRRQLLESSKKSIHCLQNYQRILLIREKKQKEISELRSTLKELAYLNKKFNDKLPKYKQELLKEEKKEEPKLEKRPKPAAPKPVAKGSAPKSVAGKPASKPTAASKSTPAAKHKGPAKPTPKVGKKAKKR